MAGLTLGSFVLIFVLASIFSSPTGKISTATPAPAGATPTPEQPDRAKFAEYFSDLKLGVLPPGAKPEETPPTPATTFAVGDQICYMSTIIKPFPWVDGIYNTQAKSYVQSNWSYRGTAEGEMVECSFPQLPIGRYEYRVWVGDTLVAAVPFDVR